MPTLVAMLVLVSLTAVAGCGARAETFGSSREKTRPVIDRPACWPLPQKVQYDGAHVIATDTFVPGPLGGRRRIVVVQVDSPPGEVSEQTRAGLAEAGFVEQTGAAPGADTAAPWFRRPGYGWLAFTVASLPDQGAGTPFRSTVTANVPGSTWDRDEDQCVRPARSPAPGARAEERS